VRWSVQPWVIPGSVHLWVAQEVRLLDMKSAMPKTRTETDCVWTQANVRCTQDSGRWSCGRAEGSPFIVTMDRRTRLYRMNNYWSRE
jgi:hypothetical protein